MKFEKEEKLDIVLQELAIHKTNQSLDKIRAIIQNWDSKLGRITARSIHQASQKGLLAYSISSKTINKYLKHFKDEIAHKNNAMVTSKEPFDVTLGGLYSYGILVQGWNVFDYAYQFTKPQEDNVDELINRLRTKMLSINLNEPEGREELYEAVERIARLDSNVDSDGLYMEMIKSYQQRQTA
jgi:hypothetical protein